MTTKPYGEGTRVPAIPDTRSSQVTDILNAVKELIEVREGVRGDGLDRNVTLRDLLNSGMATPFDLRGLGPGGGGIPTLPTAPPDPDIPPTPTNLVASGAFKYILLTWEFARGYSRLAYFEIWRSLTDAIGDAILVGQTFAPIYADEVGPGKTFYYWVRAVSDAGKSPFNALEGTPGSTAMDPTEVMKAMLEKLGYGEVDIAAGVFPFTTVDALPVLPNPKYPPGVCVLLLTDGKLYRNVGNVWTAAVAASDLTGQIVADQIEDAAISTAKFAQGIEPVKVVDALPVVAGYTGPKVVLLTTDGKLYRLVGGTWTTTIPTSDLTGQIVASQIADAILTTAKFANGIEPVGIVNALPAVAGYTGPKVVLLTTDDKLYRLDGTAWTAAVPAGDLTGQITEVQITDSAISAPKIAANAVTATKIEAGAVTATKIAADAVTAGKIAAAAVNAREIAAGAITASKLLVASRGDAINDDPHLEDISAWTPAAGINYYTSGATAPGASGSAFYAVLNTTTTDLFLRSARKFQIDPSKTYNLTAKLYTEAGNDRNMYVFVNFYDESGAQISGEVTGWGGTMSGYTYGGLPPPGVFTECGGNFGAAVPARPIPQNAKTVQVGVWFQYGVGSSSVQQAAQDIRLERVAGGTLIADGAITTDKLTANAVTAGKIAAGAVTADKVAANAITAGKIAAGSVDADKLAANSVVAGKIGAGAIVAGDGVISNAAIGTAHIIDASILNAKIGNLQIDDAKIANMSVSKLTAGTLSIGAYIESTNFLSGDTGFYIHANGNAEFNNISARGWIYGLAGHIGNVLFNTTSGIYSSNYTVGGAGFRISHEGVAYLNDARVRGTFEAGGGKFNVDLDGKMTVKSSLTEGSRTETKSLGTYIYAAGQLRVTVGKIGGAME